MHLWQLIPLERGDRNWAASTYRGKVIVRARNEAEAREVAARTFGVKTRFPLGRGVAAPPWLRRGSVRAEIAEDTRYPMDGPAEVLFPAIE